MVDIETMLKDERKLKERAAHRKPLLS